MSIRASSILLLASWSVFTYVQGAPISATGGLTLAKDIRPLLQKYCWDCHGDGETDGDLALDAFSDEASMLAKRKVWEGVQFHIENWMMPPEEKKKQPTPAEREKMAQFISAVLNPYDPNNPDPGRVTLRRLNRVEYDNTVRDLLGVTIRPANEFPEDDSGYGFDTIGDVLTLPPILMERYLSAADRVLEDATPKAPPPSVKQTYGPERLRSKRDVGRAEKGAFSLFSEGLAGVEYDFPITGVYVFRAKVWAAQAGPERARAEMRSGEVMILKSTEVSGTPERPQMLEGRAEISEGRHRVGVGFLNDFYDDKASDPARRDRNLFITQFEIEGPLTSNVQQAKSDMAQKIFGAGAGGQTEATARAVLQTFANRAFRRTALPAEVERLLSIFRLAQKSGENYTESLKMAMKAVLVSPHFLYRIEWQPEPENPARIVDINEFSLASRLSYFLWSSMPDDELLSLAFRNELRKSLTTQVKRMLRDPKARALPQNFAGQWLETRTLDVVQPDQKRFRFPMPLREAMKRETEEFFWNVMQENRSVMDFVNGSYSFLNERLAQHYGIPGVAGDHFRKVELPAESMRRGVLTHGSVLTITSDPTRTSPVKRGKWVIENILGIASPPPPPNVPPLDDDKKGPPTGTVRQRLEQHRTNPVCASCHSLLDPVGFGLESFDAIGAFRSSELGKPIDSSGVFTTGQKFSNSLELSNIITKEKEDHFLRCLTKKLLTYALGRGLEAYDRPAIDGIVARIKKENRTFESLILGVVESVPFQKRRGDASRPKTPATTRSAATSSAPK